MFCVELKCPSNTSASSRASRQIGIKEALSYSGRILETGWLHTAFHAKFRELMLHTLIRYDLACPIYTLMPDHMHFIWIGASRNSDQLNAGMWFRTQLREPLQLAKLQSQAHYHVLREKEKEDDRLLDTIRYIQENPVRAGLVSDSKE